MRFPPAAEGVTTVSVEAFANQSWPEGRVVIPDLVGGHTDLDAPVAWARLMVDSTMVWSWAFTAQRP